MTYTRELDLAVTALGSRASLLDVQVSGVAAGGLDDADLVGLGVVPVGSAKSAIARGKAASILSRAALAAREDSRIPPAVLQSLSGHFDFVG